MIGEEKGGGSIKDPLTFLIKEQCRQQSHPQ